MTASVAQLPSTRHQFIQQIAMSEGTYTLRSEPDGQHWSVQPPSSNIWFDGFPDRFEACLAIVHQRFPCAALAS